MSKAPYLVSVAALLAVPIACQSVAPTAVDSGAGGASAGSGGGRDAARSDSGGTGGGTGGTGAAGGAGGTGGSGGAGASPDVRNAGDGAADMKPAPDLAIGDLPPPGAMVCDPPEATKLPAAIGSNTYCVIDVGLKGSDTISLWQVSKASLATERLCRVSFPLTQYVVYDPPAKTYTALPAAQRQEFDAILQRMRGICQADKGQFGFAYTYEWQRLEAQFIGGPDKGIISTKNMYAQPLGGGKYLEIWPTRFPAFYDIFAVARSQSYPDVFVFDFGKTSSYADYAGQPVLILYGWGQGGRDHFAKKDATGKFVHASYVAAAAAYEVALKAAFYSTVRDQELGAPADWTKAFVAWGNGGRAKQISIATDNGIDDGLMLLALAGKLYADGKWVDEATYLALLAQLPKKADPVGTLTAADVQKAADIFKDTAAFDALRTSPSWDIYGPKLTSMPVMLGYLVKLVGTQQFVLMSRGIAAGGFIRGPHI